MQKTIKKIISFLLVIIITSFTIIVPAMTVKADSILQIPIDATKLVHNLFLYGRDVAGATYDGTMKVVNDIVSGFKQNPDTDYGVSYDEENNQFYVKYNSDNNTYVLNQNFINLGNKVANDVCYALDGYFLVIPSVYMSADDAWNTLYYRNSFTDENKNTFFNMYNTASLIYKPGSSSMYFINTDDSLFYIDNRYKICTYTINNESYSDYISSILVKGGKSKVFDDCVVNNYNLSISGLYKDDDKPNSSVLSLHASFMGIPFKLFYSKQDLQNYLNKGRQYYAPNLPVDSSGNLIIPAGYFDNNLNLPDIGVSLDSLIGKTESNVQADIDLALKNYIDKLLELNKPSPTSVPKPTPTVPLVRVTPTPDIGDRPVSPTPTPPVTDDSSDTNKLLEQIYNWLLDFGDKHETFVEQITEYIENTDGKLDQVISAIDKLSQGSTEGEQNGCKYDYTVLSEFMTKLWNDSDKKFDKMVDLLEENNYYQQRIIDALNDIIFTLKKETILDAFKNRSRETADKAKEKFPTSLPWDIALVVNAFSADSVEPVIEIPIKIESMHIDEKIVVDLSTDEWAKLAKTCRYLLSILFVLYMIHLSRKFFNKGDE